MWQLSQNLLAVIILVIFLISTARAQSSGTPGDPIGSNENVSECYKNRKPKMCLTKFWNLAYGREPVASNTCGMTSRERFCVQTSIQATSIQDRYCFYCSEAERDKSHSAKFLTDFNRENPWKTFWQSQTLYETPTRSSKFNVNITIDFGTQTQVTYIRLLFHSPRPHSMAIYRRKKRNLPWQPWAYFSRNCEAQYKMISDEQITDDNKYQPVCKSHFSDMVPLTDGNVLFVSLMDRLDVNDKDGFWKDDRMQDWVLASDILISLDRLNTHGDTFSADVLYKYFYAITDITVGGRCQCNGHAAVCNTNPTTQERSCSCQHNTEGIQCEKCRKDYNDRPWRAATQENAWECRPCNCSGNSEQCQFDWDLYYASGNVSGGRCVNCRDNTEGPHCERCLPNHRRPTPGASGCVACNCHPVGSQHGQCDDQGRCVCQPGVTGDKCDRCLTGYYNLTASGCKPCGCATEGTVNNTGECNPITGECRCKPNAAGRLCNKCRPFFFGLSATDPDGCQQCFCYGHSTSCQLHPAMSLQDTVENFTDETKRPWGVGFVRRRIDGLTVGEEQNVSAADAVEMYPERRIAAALVGLEPPYNTLYFTLPPSMLGDQSGSYNRQLRLVMSLPEDPTPDSRSGLKDVELESRGLVFSASFDSSQGLDKPRQGRFSLAFRLAHDPASSVWHRLSDSRELFRNVLAGLTQIRVRANFRGANSGGLIFASLHSITLEGTVPRTAAAAGAPDAITMHKCDCPEGHMGPMCQRCKDGYRRSVPNAGPYGACVPCDCFNHSATCNSETGECGRVEGRGLDPKELRICDHNTVGFKCDQCADGYYGNASSGVPDACKPCPCPGNSTCAQDLRSGQVICTRCPEGLSGIRCDTCALNYYGRPPNCRRCECNGNTDPNDLQVCHPDTGVCTKCIHETGGDKCERCKNGYYGNALATSGVKCRSCGCHPAGTNLTATCNPVSGECQCLPNVDGRRCDTCQQGFFNISSGTGCEFCACNYTGTGGSATCHADTGACSCLSGVGGLKCDSCLPGFFNFTERGCTPCQCNPLGIRDPAQAICDASGQCSCKQHIVGAKCDRCAENRFDVARGCPKCPDCYGVVQQLVNDLRSELAIIETLFDQTPNISAVGDVRGKLERARDRAIRLVRYLETLLGPGLSQTNQRLMQNLSRMLDEASNNLAKADTDLNQAQTFLSSRLPAIKRELQQLSQEIDAKLRPINVTLEQAQALLQDYLGLAGDVNKTNTDLLKRLKSVDSASNELERQADELRRLATQRLEESRTLMRELADAPEQVAAAEQRLGQAGREADALLELANRAEAAVEAARERATNFTARYHQLLSQLPQPDSTQLKKLNNSLDDLSKLNEQVKRKHADVSDRIRGAQANLTRVVNGAETDFRTQNDTQARTNQFYRDLLRQKAEVQELLNRSLSYNASAHELLKKLNNYKDSIEASRTDALLKIEELAKVRNVTMSANSTLQEAQRLHDDHFAAATEAAGQANDTKQLASTLYNRSESLLRDSNANLSDAMSAYQQVRSVADSLDNMETRLGQILDRQAETDLKLGQLSKLSSEAKVNASLLQRSAADLAKDIEALVNISKNGDFDAQADALNASIEALLRNATSGGGSGSGGGGVTESEQLRQVSELVSRYQLEQDSVMQEIDWLEKEHERLAKVTQELGAYDGSNCWFHFARNVE
ncbi:hypothetical protein BOX15_Mlig011187g3 [Macrostomum lignano]|uniref:Laminin subunit gamma-3 n=1 Tax=Macrostomum lignano TaxID=282301 RepID=A0A267FMH5_9PLAT|nr:hypothetical protein BOX15_Mlig011187g3 [Macrostomum lignano]